ncbi:MAG TPA: P1 family peptidase [bacterium]
MANGEGVIKKRARDLGIIVGIMAPGQYNAITDVNGVLVGHKTLLKGDDIRTGATVILPHSGNIFQEKVAAAIYVANGFGKLIGSTQVEELGVIETPIILTNTLNVFLAANALIDYTLSQEGNEQIGSINPVAGETNDGYLNNIQARAVTPEDVFEAISQAKSGPVAEGSVGAGAGTICFGFKGGIGTASRVLPESKGGYTIGVLVQTNFGGILEINGAPVGKELGKYYLKNEMEGSDGSCMIVVATDAPLSVLNLKRLAKRAILGLARTGGFCSNGSGDYVIAFSTHPSCRVLHQDKNRTRSAEELYNDQMSPLFLAVVEATQEAIYNSLFMASTVTGWHNRTVAAIPIERVVEICKKYNVIK